MVVLLGGLNDIRDLHRAQVDKGELGTDGTAPNESQTDLVAGVGATELAVTITSADKTNVFSYVLLSGVGAGNTYREFKIEDSVNGVNYDRCTFTGVAHTANDDLIVKKTWFYRNP